jgi:hypothetical protein
MKSRITRTTLFKKNHIELVREDYTTQVLTPGIKSRSSGSNDDSYYWGVNRYRYREKEVKLKSPLGFWYTKTIRVSPDDGKGKLQKSWSGQVYEFSLPKTKYILNYLVRYGNQYINVEVRPWELNHQDKAMPDHFVEDLKREIDKVLDIVSQNKLGNTEELRRKIYTDLFGFPSGPKYQTDLEKIESHGFDKAVSFRNRKE